MNTTIPRVATGDPLLFRGKNMFIAATTGSWYTHAGMAVLKDGIVFVREIRELIWKGGFRFERSGYREIPLAQSAGNCCVDCFKFRDPSYDGEGAARYMTRFAGCDYAYRSVLRIWASRLMFVRMFVPLSIIMDDELPIFANTFCSSTVSAAARAESGGGVDPVPNLADGWTTPGDIARSGALFNAGRVWDLRCGLLTT